MDDANAAKGTEMVSEKDHAVVALAAEVVHLSDQLVRTGRDDRTQIELIREGAFEILRGLTDQVNVFRKPGIADSYGTHRPGNDRLTRYRDTIRAVLADIDENPRAWSERIRARDGRGRVAEAPVCGVNLERLRLVETLRNSLEIAQGFFAPNLSGYSDSEHPEGWRFLRLAGEQLKPLGSLHAARFDAALKGRGEAVAVRDGAFLIVSEAFQELAAEVYTLPKSRPTHLLDRLDFIVTDTNEVAVLIVHCVNKSEGLRYLFQNLINELRTACDNGRSQLTPGARSSARAVLEHFVNMSMKFNAMPFADDQRGEIFKEARQQYGDLPVLLERVGEEFRLMREDEKRGGRAHVINVLGDVTHSHLHAGDNMATQNIGASLSEVLDLTAQLRTAFADLPEATRIDAIEVLDGIEHQAKSTKPSKGIIRAFLETLRKTAETGNEIAGFTERVLPLLERLGPYLAVLAAAG